MPPHRLYKGAAPGTHWHDPTNDPRHVGFTCAARAPTAGAIVDHITRYSHPSPFLSFSTSFAVARAYALSGPGGRATVANPGKVFVVDASLLETNGVRLVDPFVKLDCPDGADRFHDGDQVLVPAIASNVPALRVRPVHKTASALSPPASLGRDLEALVFALRDAELLSHGSVPSTCIVGVEHVW